jgi:hypothetical protein
MAGLVPAATFFEAWRTGKAWMPGTRPGMTKKETGGLAEGD